MFADNAYTKSLQSKSLFTVYFIVFVIIACIVIFLVIYFLFLDYQNRNKPVEINSITPNSGPVTGGTQVTISGSGFLPSNQKDNNLLDTTFNPGDGPNDSIRTVSLQPDGKILIGGVFTKYKDTPRNRIARLNSDGSLDTTFNPGSGANNTIQNLALQPDGRILISGRFTEYNGTPRNHIARLNSDGSLDTTFNPGSGADYDIDTIVLQPDGKILIEGLFTKYNGTPRNRIARLNPDGSLDTTFDSKKRLDASINTIILQPNGKILVGCIFINYNGAPINYIARLNPDGSLDTTFDPKNGPDNPVYAIALQPDGKILIGGTFTEYNGTPRRGIARLNPDGSLDTTFDPKKGATSVTIITLQPDGKILIGGDFIEYNGTPRGSIARLNPDGSLDTTFDSKKGIDGKVYAIILQPDEKILIGGYYTKYNGISRKRITRINQTVSNKPLTITIGENNCTNVVLVSSTKITCITPPGTIGAKDVVVINGYGKRSVLENGFTYNKEKR